MACYHPMKAIRKKGEKTYKIMPKSDDTRDWIPYVDKSTGEYYDQILLPCGKCIGCRLEYSRQWANRCVLESLDHPRETNWFLTLTFNDNCLKDYVNDRGFATVRTDDITTFMKALRGRWSTQHNVDGIRFFGASEYGDESMRPHYHILVFGLPLYDLVKYKNNFQGDVIYSSEELDHVWKRGFVRVAEFNWNTAAYTARYVMKKANGMNACFYDALGIEPEKTRMSRMPGIGQGYLEKHIHEIYELDEIVLPASAGGKLQVISPPKYYDRKLESIDPVWLARLKADRNRVAELRAQAAGQQHGYDPYEYLAIQEESKLTSLNVFQRKGLTDQ